ncbi:hypothetical protein [Brevibacterium marinum]|uniref:SH3 domain-containing protein n=1 Tax=Brevibacterium marinum TaxID=418643 RepID=A0A846S495_9MICO|nr:hypothetical protein [Brevibacterium marinum]NJC58420.1 hypothetical protein [Brevibacterium marinum]
MRDLFLLFAGLLSLVVLFVPYMSDGFVPWSLWHWGIDTMGTLVFNVFAIWLIVAAVFVNKFGSGRVRIGSLSLDQSISALSGAAFTYAFVHLLTTVQFWHVGAYLAFFAALVAFFAGVFTMIPFFGKEFAIRDEAAAHPKARPVSKGAPHPAPVANMPGPSNGPGGYGAPYGGQPGMPIGSQSQPGGYPQPNQPGGYGQPGQPNHPGGYGQPAQPGYAGAPGQYSQQGQPEQFADSGQAGQHAGPGQPGQYAGSGQPAAPAQQFTQPGDNGQPDGQDQFGQPIGSEQNSPYAPPQQRAQEFSHRAAPDAGDSSDQAAQSTGSGQTYLGAQYSDAPQHTQSEPTQTFGFGAQREGSPSNNDGETAVQAPVPADADSSSGESAADADRGSSVDGATDTANSTDTGNSGDYGDDDSSGAGAGAGAGIAAGAAGTGAVGVGAAVAGANSETERPRGRHAAPESDTDVEAADGDGDRAAESSTFATKVNGHDSDTNVRASEGVALKPESSFADAQESSDDSGNVEHSQDLTGGGRSTTGSTTTDSSATHTSAFGGDSAFSGDRDEDEGPGVVTGDSQSGPDRTAQPEAEEPTQYVPVAGHGSSRRDSDVDEEETVVQSAVQPGGNLGDDENQSTQSRDGADQDGSSREGPDGSGSDQGNGQKVIQAFWFAVPEPREAVDATTGMPVFTIYPGDWFLGLEDHGSWFKVRDSDGREGLLRNIEGIQRG